MDMRWMMRAGRHWGLVLVASGVVAVAAAAQPEAQRAAFSAERLQRFDRSVQGMIDAGQLSGMVSLLSHRGKTVHSHVLGRQDIASNTPMARDTIFRAYSMTKPVTGVAMMMLYEEGRWSPSDPITKFIPEFAEMQVYTGMSADGRMLTEGARRVPTMAELMSHTAGFGYGLFPGHPVEALFQKANIMGSASRDEAIGKLAKIPLRYQPGSEWQYSISVDIQGYILERITGQRLDDFMQQRIFGPLGMKDTAFRVPEDKLPRLATIYSAGADGKLAPVPRDPNVSRAPVLASGGAGLYSTADDYLRFARMLAGGGQVDGVRLLAPRTVQLMATNHLSPRLLEGGYGIGMQQLKPGFGFGFDVAVYEDPFKAQSVIGKGSFLWDGAAGTFFWVDPENDLVFVGMIQRMGGGPSFPRVQELARPLLYQALLPGGR